MVAREHTVRPYRGRRMVPDKVATPRRRRSTTRTTNGPGGRRPMHGKRSMTEDGHPR
jgi:hypothetical protein